MHNGSRQQQGATVNLFGGAKHELQLPYDESMTRVRWEQKWRELSMSITDSQCCWQCESVGTWRWLTRWWWGQKGGGTVTKSKMRTMRMRKAKGLGFLIVSILIFYYIWLNQKWRTKGSAYLEPTLTYMLSQVILTQKNISMQWVRMGQVSSRVLTHIDNSTLDPKKLTSPYTIMLIIHHHVKY